MASSTQGRVSLAAVGFRDGSGDPDIVRRLGWIAVHENGLVEEAVKLHDEETTGAAEYYQTSADRIAAKALIRTHEAAVAAGVVESGSKDRELTSLARNLSSAVSSPPDYVRLLQRRSVMMDLAVCLARTDDADSFWNQMVQLPEYRPRTLPKDSLIVRGPDWQCVKRTA